MRTLGRAFEKRKWNNGYSTMPEMQTNPSRSCLRINSSFLYRDKSVKTNQSPRRLLVQMNASGKNVRGEPCAWRTTNG